MYCLLYAFRRQAGKLNVRIERDEQRDAEAYNAWIE